MFLEGKDSVISEIHLLLEEEGMNVGGTETSPQDGSGNGLGKCQMKAWVS